MYRTNHQHHDHDHDGHPHGPRGPRHGQGFGPGSGRGARGFGPGVGRGARGFGPGGPERGGSFAQAVGGLIGAVRASAHAAPAQRAQVEAILTEARRAVFRVLADEPDTTSAATAAASTAAPEAGTEAATGNGETVA